MSEKPRKVGEPKAAYTAKKAAKDASASRPGPHYADLEKVKATNAKLIQVHHKVLQKLAQ